MSTPGSAPQRGAGQRAGLSREAVLAAAHRVADSHGLDGLTMRRLAAELGVMPNALYTYFPHKEALLDALVDDLLAGIELDGSWSGDWRDGLTRIMDASRRLVLAHPQLVPVIMGRPGLGPNAARLGELCLGLLARGGVEGEPAVEAFRVLLAYSLGFGAFQAPRVALDPGARAARAELAEASFGGLPEDRFPLMHRLAGPLADPTGDREFHTGLAWLLDGIEARSGQDGRARRPRRSRSSPTP
jgi:TetR/AcrR family transcriptional regulator, tetracycline repressor protein